MNGLFPPFFPLHYVKMSSDLDALLAALTLDGAPASTLLDEATASAGDSQSAASRAAWEAGYGAWEKAQEGSFAVARDASDLEAPFARSPAGAGGGLPPAAQPAADPAAGPAAQQQGGGEAQQSGDAELIRSILTAISRASEDGSGAEQAGGAQRAGAGGEAEGSDEAFQVEEMLALLASGKAVRMDAGQGGHSPSK
jgi:hypothetical protein